MLLVTSGTSGQTTLTAPDDNHRRAHMATASLRLAVSLAFLVIILLWSQSRGVRFSALGYPMSAYVALSALNLGLHRRAAIRRLSWIMSLLDVVLLFVLLSHGVAADPQHRPAWGVTSLGAYIMAVVLTGLTLPMRFVVVHTALAAIAVSLLLRAAGLSLWQPLVATITLAFTAAATGIVPRLTEIARKRTEEAASAQASLARAQAHNQQLERLEREKDALFETIVHDMRSPVGAAILSLEYLALELRRLPDQAELTEAANDALGVLSSLSRMIGQLLDVSKLESGRMTLRLDRCKLRPALDAAVAAASSRARSRSITLTVDVSDDLVGTIESRLFPSALDVLLGYLIRHTPEGGRVLLAAVRAGSGVRVSVHGDGPKLSATDREHLFDKLPPLDHERRRSSTWTAGLYFCALVVAAHQGTIAIEDSDGWTLSLVISLPV
jgi:signal transduction histidine kinase